MCGICGICGEHDKNIVKRFSKKIAHRGPDARGVFFDKNISLGVRRLSIIDVKKGNQPIYNEKKDKVIVFNGEIYNYKELRNVLINKGHEFGTDSDTEVVLHLYEEFGSGCFEKLNGQFALAIYDINKKELIVARDPLGIKPLFFYYNDKSFYFASEIKAFFETDLIPKEINYASLLDYEIFGYPLYSSTLLKDIFQLPPGRFIRIRFDKKTGLSGGVFWKNETKINKSIKFNDAAKEIGALIEDSVIKRFDCSDVGMGVELSGGVDSSLICKILSKNSKEFNTYSIDENLSSEDIKHARFVSKQVNSNHHEFVIGRDELVKRFPEYIYCIEQLNYYGLFHHILSKNIKKNNKTVLCGQGGDELFGGYGTVLDDKKYIKGISGNLNCSLKIFSPFRQKNAPILKHYSKIKREIIGLSKGNTTQNVLSFEQQSQLRNFMLLVDRALFFGVEVRVPYLDARLVEYTNQLPLSYKIKNGTGKIIFKKVVKGFGLDKRIINRKKVIGPDSTKNFFQKLEKVKINNKNTPNFSSNGLRLAYLVFNDIFIKNKGKLRKNFSVSDLI